MTKTIWLSPLKDECQLCGEPFNGVMYDCAIHAGGPWGNICDPCFKANNCRTGTGLGQKYELQDYNFGSTEVPNIRKAWVCVEGGIGNG